ncbi:MAG: hypothetical protein L3J32_05880, partial [Rhizobiaceae bacterium]|nr:hypothetical protein [Rhizobiaceae bacterium]
PASSLGHTRHVTVHALLLPTHGTFGTRAVVCRVDQWEQYMGSAGGGDKYFEILLLFCFNNLLTFSLSKTQTSPSFLCLSQESMPFPYPHDNSQAWTPVP